MIQISVFEFRKLVGQGVRAAGPERRQLVSRHGHRRRRLKNSSWPESIRTFNHLPHRGQRTFRGLRFLSRQDGHRILLGCCIESGGFLQISRILAPGCFKLIYYCKCGTSNQRARKVLSISSLFISLRRYRKKIWYEKEGWSRYQKYLHFTSKALTWSN